MQVYSKIAKFEANEDGSLTVYGVASSDAKDSDGDIIPSETIANALPEYFKKGGQLKEMHKENTNAGVVDESTQTCDESCKTYITAKVTDKDAITKVKAGIYKGFSIGGSVVKRNEDDNNIIDEIIMDEISLVPRPANEEAKILLAKSHKGETMDKEKVIEKTAKRKDVKPKEGEKKYGDVKFADDKNNKYPIDTEEHIRAAWNYINKKKNAGKYSEEDANAIKAKIVSAWKKVIDKDGPPSEKEDIKKSFDGQEVFDASTAINALVQLSYLIQSEQYEAEQEGEDESEQLSLLLDAVEKIKAFIASEIMENTTAEEETEAEPIAKAGKAISSSNKDKLKEMHGHAEAIQKMCKDMHGSIDDENEEEDNKGEDIKKSAKDDEIENLQSKYEALEKRLKEIESMPLNKATLMVSTSGEELKKSEKPSQLQLIEQARLRALNS